MRVIKPGGEHIFLISVNLQSRGAERLNDMLGRQARELNGGISQAMGGGGDVEKVRHVWRSEGVDGPECIQQDFSVIMELNWRTVELRRD